MEPFGRGLRGRSNVFITKDRPGHLRAHRKATKTPGKTFVGTLVIDDTGTPDFIEFYAPKDDEDAPESVTSAGLADIVRAPARRQTPHSRRYRKYRATTEFATRVVEYSPLCGVLGVNLKPPEQEAGRYGRNLHQLSKGG